MAYTRGYRARLILPLSIVGAHGGIHDGVNHDGGTRVDDRNDNHALDRQRQPHWLIGNDALTEQCQPTLCTSIEGMTFKVAILGLWVLIWRILYVLDAHLQILGAFLGLGFRIGDLVSHGGCGGCANRVNGSAGGCCQRSATIHVFLTSKWRFVSLFASPTGDDQLR
ncbi:hypothetical protein V8G54_019304 [Vigna mungo]|uniref:Uncharacterized protein n=1 Tax=Vigna mungo TaxID=3915 RepID=A0AAQ3RUU2_VIGMU